MSSDTFHPSKLIPLNPPREINWNTISNVVLYVTSFVINNVPPQLLTSPMNDMKLTQEEHKINNELTHFSLDSLSMPIIDGGQDDPSFSRGWGFWSDGVAIITLVEK